MAADAAKEAAAGVAALGSVTSINDIAASSSVFSALLTRHGIRVADTTEGYRGGAHVGAADGGEGSGGGGGVEREDKAAAPSPQFAWDGRREEEQTARAHTWLASALGSALGDLKLSDVHSNTQRFGANWPKGGRARGATRCRGAVCWQE